MVPAGLRASPSGRARSATLGLPRRSCATGIAVHIEQPTLAPTPDFGPSVEWQRRLAGSPVIFAILGAIAVGLSLGIFGSGGSILTVPVLVYLLGHEDKIAIAESLAIVGSIALIGALPSVRDGTVRWGLVLLFGVPGMAGAFLGAWLAAFVPGAVQLLVFGGVMLAAAARMWQRSRVTPLAIEPGSTQPKRWLVIILGTGVGVLTGFVGVGGGFLIVPALVLLARIPMRQAVASSLIIIAMNTATGLIKHHRVLSDAENAINWSVIIVFIAVGAAGSLVGRSIQSRINQRVLQQAFAVFLVAMSLFIIARETLRLVA